MRRTAFYSVLISLVVLLFSGCDEKIIEVTGISLDQVTLELPMESAVTLLATLEPSGAEGDILWSSSDPTVAVVNNGVVTGIKIGTTTIAATCGAFTASCEVTVTAKQIDPNNLPESLKGTNYHVIQMDEISYEFIKDKVDNDFRPDEDIKNLWVWENTFVAGTPVGTNFYGQNEGWVSLIVSIVGWSGAGWNLGTGYGTIDMTDMYDNPDDYVFHVALKSSQLVSGYLFKFTDKSTSAAVCIGNVPIEGVAPYRDFVRDNEWQEIEIPVSYLNSLGLFYNKAFSDNLNIVEFLAGGAAGITLDMDAVFFYKKASK
ncbi:MAG: Ig-like domain-containing protein [Bacteroidota bacterium]